MVEPTSSRWRSERPVILALILLPLIGALASVVLALARGLDAIDLVSFAAFYVWTGLGITVGYHRLFTHRAFAAHAGVRHVLAIAGAMAIQGPASRWVADHRRHHAHADRPGDPHSPVVRGLWHAHLGWLFTGDRTDIARYAPDVLADPTLVRVERRYVVWVGVSLAAPTLLGWVLGGPDHALSGFLFAGLARICLLQHVTWSVNSICHRFGSQAFATRDQSRNNWLVGLFALGEGWHNNHHAFPSSARQGLLRGQIDPSWGLIWLLERLGLVFDVRRVSESRRTSARIDR